MTQQPYGQPPQGYPQPQQPGYAQPQYGQQPAPYQGQPAAQPAYAPPVQQQGYPPAGYPPAGYPPQPQFQPPQYGQPPAQAPRPSQPSTVRDFWDQPTSGGKSLPFDRPGTRYLVTVIRSVTDADIVEQTDIRDPSIVATYRDGRPKKMMLVPVLLHQPTPEFPDGQAVWYVKGNTKGELTRAMEAAGIAPDPETGFMPAPRAGDVIDITYTHDKPMGRGMNPMKVLRIVYTPGNGVGPDLSGYGQAPVQQPNGGAQWGNPQYQPPGYQNGYVTPGTATVMPNPVMSYQAQAPQFQDPAQYQQATGQPMPPQQQYQPAPPQGPYGQPNAEWNPYAQQNQPGPTAPPAPQGAPPGAASTAPAAPSSPPPDWPADVPFRPGLTVEQARLAALHGIPPAQ